MDSARTLPAQPRMPVTRTHLAARSLCRSACAVGRGRNLPKGAAREGVRSWNLRSDVAEGGQSSARLPLHNYRLTRSSHCLSFNPIVSLRSQQADGAPRLCRNSFDAPSRTASLCANREDDRDPTQRQSGPSCSTAEPRALPCPRPARPDSPHARLAPLCALENCCAACSLAHACSLCLVIPVCAVRRNPSRAVRSLPRSDFDRRTVAMRQRRNPLGMLLHFRSVFLLCFS